MSAYGFKIARNTSRLQLKFSQVKSNFCLGNIFVATYKDFFETNFHANIFEIKYVLQHSPPCQLYLTGNANFWNWNFRIKIRKYFK